MTVFLVVLHFTVMGYTGRALPQGDGIAFTVEADCKKSIPAVRRALQRAAIPMQPDRIVCERFEVK